MTDTSHPKPAGDQPAAEDNPFAAPAVTEDVSAPTLVAVPAAWSGRFASAIFDVVVLVATHIVSDILMPEGTGWVGHLPVLTMFLVLRPLSALVFRVSLFHHLRGMSCVRADGTPAGRLRCAVRASMPYVMAPVLAMYWFNPFDAAVDSRDAHQALTAMIALALVLFHGVTTSTNGDGASHMDRQLGCHIVVFRPPGPRKGLPGLRGAAARRRRE